MFLENGPKRIVSFQELKSGKLDLLASIGLRVVRAKSSFLLCNVSKHRSLADVFETFLDVGHDRRVYGSRSCSLRTGRGAHGTHCARFPCVEAAGVEIA